ncbi:LysR family transcriptional regulator [Burkholderia multivorans]|uniref:LysR family transcriptional regulator n=1 Tax=Burkholderia multivorans TaxID=87883 RepID=UPI0019D236CB|nr:LysR family transcriptional regulator [Burkholderia multivorans]MBN7130532.1 LysR family transcriptional regulator [Burkholderia multivorans]QSL25733.1 LysR family transcriptional regulator [Burkholderia multivorans]
MNKDKPATYINDRLDWNLLRTFLVIAHEQSISRAASRLHLTQPAVSQALRRLEEQLGLQLANRQGTGIQITRAGNEIRHIAEEMYGTVSRIQLVSGESEHDLSGIVRVSTVSGVEFPDYDAFLAAFHHDHPRIEIESQEMRSTEVVRTLEIKAATIGLTPKRALPKHVDHRLFLRQRYALFCGRFHPLFSRMDLQLGDLVQEKLVSFTGDRLGDHMSKLSVYRDEMGFTGQVVGSSSSMTEVKRLIIAGFGIGFLPEHVVRDDVAQGRLRRLPPEDGIDDLDIHLLWSTDRKYSAAESAFIDSLHLFIDHRYASRIGCRPNR